MIQLLSEQLLNLQRRMDDQHAHSLENCLILESPHNRPRDSTDDDSNGLRAVREVSAYFPGFRMVGAEVHVVHRLNPWAWIVR